MRGDVRDLPERHHLLSAAGTDLLPMESVASEGCQHEHLLGPACHTSRPLAVSLLVHQNTMLMGRGCMDWDVQDACAVCVSSSHPRAARLHWTPLTDQSSKTKSLRLPRCLQNPSPSTALCGKSCGCSRAQDTHVELLHVRCMTCQHCSFWKDSLGLTTAI